MRRGGPLKRTAIRALRPNEPVPSGEPRRYRKREEVAKMRELYLSGMTTIQVGEAVGIDPSNVYRRLAAAGVRMRQPLDYATELDVAHVVEQYRAGRGIKAVAREARVGTDRIRDALRNAGVALRGPGRVPQKPEWTEAAGRGPVIKRSGGVCEIRVAGQCDGRAVEWQHRKNRSQGGTWAPSNGLHICSSCHGYIHQHPNLAVERGWTVPSWADPATTPAEVWMWGHMQAAALLDDAGDYHLHREPEHS